MARRKITRTYWTATRRRLNIRIWTNWNIRNWNCWRATRCRRLTGAAHKELLNIRNRNMWQRRRRLAVDVAVHDLRKFLRARVCQNCKKLTFLPRHERIQLSFVHSLFLHVSIYGLAARREGAFGSVSFVIWQLLLLFRRYFLACLAWGMVWEIQRVPKNKSRILSPTQPQQKL